MLLFENIALALSGLMANKMRALLTMLGIIIGIGSVIAIMTVGESMTMSITESMQAMGANNITVGLRQKSSGEEEGSNGMMFSGPGRQRQPTEDDYITDEMLANLTEQYGESIEGIALTEALGGSGIAEDGKLYANVTVSGVNSDYFLTNELTILAGRNLSERDIQAGKGVAVVSDKFVNNMFGGDTGEAVGSRVEVNVNNKYYNFTIIGVYEYEESSMGFSSSSEEDIVTEMYIPLAAAQEANRSDGGYENLTIVTATGADSAELVDKIQQLFDVYYRNNENFQVSAYSMESMVSSMTEMLSTISLAIAVIAAISLLVGGIGVMNIMLVSITERTREIGTRKALGATNGSIRLQFIVESIVICLLGGIIGVVVGVGLGAVASNALGYSAQPAISSIVISLLFSMSIGVFFGYYPANKAAKLNPIEALRYE